MPIEKTIAIAERSFLIAITPHINLVASTELIFLLNPLS
jgi:hypothetical protein